MKRNKTYFQCMKTSEKELLNKEVETIKKNWVKILELKNTISEMKKSFDKFIAKWTCQMQE